MTLTPFQQDVEALASRLLDGKYDLVAKNMETWPEDHKVTPEQFWALTLARVAFLLPHLEGTLAWMKGAKERGRNTYYSFQTGLMTMDEAIAWEEGRIARGYDALSMPIPTK